ncbi:YfiR family protein [Flavobacterium acetivorans]|uniref:YfiR family protein n=1 Tax=Flavobacterium acetivorans TaxID=2893883 RepID=UPI001E61CE27|nr:YfiR family protein [Flavobacterium sp. F-29]UFH36327.1 YfiR family protein [Flavobacterium sp. F-29]
MTIKSYIYILSLITIFTGVNPLTAQEDMTDNAYAMKADFLYRFIDYVRWKDNPKNQAFKIAVLESSPITPLLISNAKNKKTEIKEYKDIAQVGSCNILFVPYNCSIPIETIISKFSDRSVLIVTERNGFGKKGAHLNFIIIENKLKFEINLKAINKSGIGVSSFLLQHAIIVQ